MSVKDIAALNLGWGQGPYELLKEGLKLGEGECWAVLADGVPAAIFGAVPDEADKVSGTGANVWLMTCEGFERIGRRFVRHSGEYIDKLLEKYGRLYGYVESGNIKMLAWLRKNGFTLTELDGGYVRCDKKCADL